MYKLWNRISSGSYFPPPVRIVEIPKGDGEMRKLGIPTVSDRIAKTVVKLYLEPVIDPQFHSGVLWIQARKIGDRCRRLIPGKGAGNTIMLSISISRDFSITSITNS